MSEISSTSMEIKIDTLVPFSQYASQTYEGSRLEQMMNSIERVGLMEPIIVRPVDDGKYEIICGHNRTKAMKELGYDVIQADVRDGLTDEEALMLFFESNLNQQSFSDWSYSQKIEAIKYTEKQIHENSQQGRRTDLEKKQLESAEDETCVQIRQKLNGSISKRNTARDKMAQCLGISTATYSKFRRIIKLPDNILTSIVRLLDEKRITFEAAYIISAKRERDIKILIKEIEKHPDYKLDLNRLKELPPRRVDNNSSIVYPISKENIQKVLIPPKSPNVMIPHQRKK